MLYKNLKITIVPYYTIVAWSCVKLFNENNRSKRQFPLVQPQYKIEDTLLIAFFTKVGIFWNACTAVLRIRKA